ncbi:MMPL family transporter [Nocardioides sp.]|uniref:MMPL family transporter n=1 Tax=Nocardioides sp. TaxID=35761 RepID=UPI002D8000B6|nr:MMPL family transporter [Nocardioides sp.]HET8959049.1 MMPL family transporter [Nocardioides sp.]
MSADARGLTPARAVAAVLLGLLGAGVLIGVLGEAELTPGVTDTAPVGADSTRVLELQSKFTDGGEQAAVVLYATETGTLSPADVASLERGFGEATGSPAPLRLSDDGTAAIGVTTVPGTGSAAISDGVAELRTEVARDLPEGVSAQVTGPAAIQADLSAVFDGADTRLLLVTACVVAVLLILTYRSPILWVIPLAVVGLADRLAAVLATQTLAAVDIPWDESTVGILSVLVFGAGTDYALLLISRYRDELRLHEDRYAAMRRAWRRTAEAVLSSASTVVVGVLTLLLCSFPTTRGLGVASAVGIVVAAAGALLLLPAALVLCGRWVFWPVVPRVGQQTLVESNSFWGRVGRVVGRVPGRLVAGSVLLLAVMAAGLTQVETGLSTSEQFLDEPEAIAAADRLAESYPAGASEPTVVVTAEDPDQVAETVAAVPRAAPGPAVAGTDGWSRLTVVLDAVPGSAAAEQAVLDLRSALGGYDETYVGGAEAEAIDEADAAARDRRVVIPLVLLLVLVVLMLLLRSVVAPLILVATVVGTYLAALGVSWWVFTGLLGFEAIDVGMPLLAFLFLVALGVDYNIFLVTRAAEESPGSGTRDGMLRALTATGGVITSAGILLAAVFAVLGVLPLVVLAQLGVVIGIGVLLDTLLVRTVLVPAIAVGLGEWFWWPRKFGPRTPRREGATRSASHSGGREVSGALPGQE